MVVGLPPAAYAASKGGIEAFTRYLAGAGAPHGVRVNCVAPGEIITPATEPGGQRLFQQYFETIQLTEGPGQPIDVANVVTFLASDEARFVNAQTIAIDGGAAGKV
jgi:3-oxoacyl-[acyl-carrier protein] reductase